MTAIEAIEPVPFIDGIVYGEGPRWHNDWLWFSDGPAGRVCSVSETGDVAVEAEVKHASGLGWLPDGTSWYPPSWSQRSTTSTHKGR